MYKAKNQVVRNEVVRNEFESAELELFDPYKAYGELVESLKIGVVVIDDVGEIRVWNSKAENIFGYSKKEALGRNFMDMAVTEDGGSRILSAYNRLVDRTVEGNSSIQDVSTKKNGSPIYIELKFSRILIDGIPHVLGQFEDKVNNTTELDYLFHGLRDFITTVDLSSHLSKKFFDEYLGSLKERNPEEYELLASSPFYQIIERNFQSTPGYVKKIDKSITDFQSKSENA